MHQQKTPGKPQHTIAPETYEISTRFLKEVTQLEETITVIIGWNEGIGSIVWPGIFGWAVTHSDHSTLQVDVWKPFKLCNLNLWTLFVWRIFCDVPACTGKWDWRTLYSKSPPRMRAESIHSSEVGLTCFKENCHSFFFGTAVQVLTFSSGLWFSFHTNRFIIL